MKSILATLAITLVLVAVANAESNYAKYAEALGTAIEKNPELGRLAITYQDQERFLSPRDGLKDSCADPIFDKYGLEVEGLADEFVAGTKTIEAAANEHISLLHGSILQLQRCFIQHDGHFTDAMSYYFELFKGESQQFEALVAELNSNFKDHPSSCMKDVEDRYNSQVETIEGMYTRGVNTVDECVKHLLETLTDLEGKATKCIGKTSFLGLF